MGIAAEGEDPLSKRQLRYWAWPFGSTGSFKSDDLIMGTGLENNANESEIGKTITKIHQKENLRVLYVGMTRAKDRLILAHRNEDKTWLDTSAPRLEGIAPSSLKPGTHKLPDGIETTLVVRQFSPATVSELTGTTSREEPWIRAHAATPPTTPFTERYHAPSAQIPFTEPDSNLQITPMTGRPCFPSGASQNDYVAIGDAAHSYMAAIPSLKALDHEAKMKIATRCINGFRVSGHIYPENLVTAGETFVAWVETNYPGAIWHSEVYASAPRPEGGQWEGWMDLLLELPTGELVLIDHKTAPLMGEKCLGKAKEYTGQLKAYRSMLTSAGKSVVDTWIHFPFGSSMVKVSFSASSLSPSRQ